MPNTTYTLNLSHDELVLILLGLANSPEIMDVNLARARRLFPDLGDKLPILYKELAYDTDHGWSTHDELYRKVFTTLKEGN